MHNWYQHLFCYPAKKYQKQNSVVLGEVFCQLDSSLCILWISFLHCDESWKKWRLSNYLPITWKPINILHLKGVNIPKFTLKSFKCDFLFLQNSAFQQQRLSSSTSLVRVFVCSSVSTCDISTRDAKSNLNSTDAKLTPKNLAPNLLYWNILKTT